MIEYYINSITGEDSIDAGTVNKPFKTLDYCIAQIHTRNIRNLNLDNEEEVLTYLRKYPEENKNNDDIETLNEDIINEEELYLYSIMNRAYNDDVTIYLDEGEYILGTLNVYKGAEGKTLSIIGKGGNTVVKYGASMHNNGDRTGTLGFNLFIARLILNFENISSNSYFNGGLCNQTYNNILFDVPQKESLKFGHGCYYTYTKNEFPNFKFKFINCVGNMKTPIVTGYSNTFTIENSYGLFNFYWRDTDVSINNNNKFVKNIDELELDENYKILDKEVNTKEVGLYAGDFAWKVTKCLIKINDEYYTITEDYYNQTTKAFDKLDDIDFEKGFNIVDLTKEVIYGNDTFVPIDKFDNFSIVFDEDIEKLKINGLKIDNKIVETNTIDLRMVEYFNSFKINGENVKCLIKINGKDDIYSYNFNTNELNIITIDDIYTNGIDINKIKDIDFNKIKNNYELKNISFIFYITEESFVENIIINYLKIGEFSEKNPSELKLSIGYKNINFQPTFDANILKVNIIWGNNAINNSDVNNSFDLSFLDNYQTKIDNNLITNDKSIVGAINEISEQLDDGNNSLDLSILDDYQTKSDNNLQTNNKTIVGSINEINKLLENGVQSNLIAGNGINIEDNIVTVKIDNNTLILNENGELEVKISSDENIEGHSGIKQYIIKDVKNGQTYTIKDEGLPVNQKLITSVMALEQQETFSDIITDFKIDEEDIISNNGISINNLHTINVTNGISEVIDKSQFLMPILNLKGV